jgi:hypothetical protein
MCGFGLRHPGAHCLHHLSAQQVQGRGFQFPGIDLFAHAP